MSKKFLPALFILLCLVPLGLSIGYSFLYSIGAVGLLSDGLTLEHWRELFRGEFLQSMLFSIWIALASAGVALFLALSALFRLRETFSRRITSNMLFIPLTIPPIVLSFVVFQLFSGSGFVSRAAYHSGLIDGPGQFPVIVQDPAGIGIIIAHVFIVFPFFFLVLMTIYRNEKLGEIERVASSLGADASTIRFRLQLPVLIRRLFPVLLLYIIFFMGAYDIPLILGQSSPQMMSVHILEKLQRFNLNDIPVAYSMAVLYAIICMTSVSYLMLIYRRREVL